MSLAEQIKDLVATGKNPNIKNGALYTLFSFINNGINFVMVLVLAGYLQPGEYGSLNLFHNFITLLNIFIALCTASYVTVSFFKTTRRELQQIIFIVIVTATLMLALISGVLALNPAFARNSVGIGLGFLWMGLLICYNQVFINMNLDIWRLEEKPVHYGIFSVAMTALNVLFTFYLIIALKSGWAGRAYAQFGVTTLFALISVATLIRRGYIRPTKIEWSRYREILLFALPLMPHMASFWVKQGLDRYIIKDLYDNAAVGIYSIAMNFAGIIMIAGQAFNSANSVYIYKQLAGGYRNTKASLDRQSRTMTLLFMAFSFCIMAGSALFIPLALPKYTESVKYLIPLCCGSFFQCIYLLYVNYLFFYNRTRQLMYITFSTALLQAALSIWLTRYSILYTAYISMSIYALTAAAVGLSARHILRGVLDGRIDEEKFRRI